jgi:hypothetical protein
MTAPKRRWLLAVSLATTFFVSSMLSLYSLNAAVFFAWEATTPTIAFPHDVAQWYADIWGGVFVGSVAVAILSLPAAAYALWRDLL